MTNPYSSIRFNRPSDRIPPLRKALEAEKGRIEADRRDLRRKIAEVEWELNQLTGQQAELQKLVVAIDRVLKALDENHSNGSPGCEARRVRGLADSAIPGTY